MSLKLNNNILDENILSKATINYTAEWLKSLKETPEFETSDAFKNKMNDLFVNGAKRKVKHITLKTIVIFAAILSIMTSMICVDAVRKGIIEFFTETFGTYNTIKHETIEEDNYVEATEITKKYNTIIKDKYVLNLTDEYELIDETATEESTFFLYFKNTEQLVFEQFTNKYYKENINKENTKNTEKTIDGETYYISFVEQSGETKIVWEKDGYIFSIYSNLSESELIELSKTIKKEN